MRKVLPVLLMFAVAGCATLRWDKPGATDATIANDMVACRQAAQQEAMRYPWGYYPWGGFGMPIGMHRGNWMLWQMRQDNDRFYLENRLSAFCMRTKGYEQVEVRQAPQTQAPPAPSPEPPLPK